jgi:hypothetical protein
VGIDITNATIAEFQVKKPDGTLETWVASVYAPTKLSYIVQEGDFDQIGKYYLQAYIETADFMGKGETATFQVYDSYK